MDLSHHAKTPTIISTTSGEFLSQEATCTITCIYYKPDWLLQQFASSQIPDWIHNTVDRLQRTSWQGTYLHPRNDHPIKKQKIFYNIQWRTCPEGSKIQAWYFRQACICSVCMGLWHGIALPKEIRLCDEIEAFKRNLKTHLFVKLVNESCNLILKNYCKAS